MKLIQKINLSVGVLITCLCLQVSAQKTSIYDNPQATYDQAVDLYNKEKFGSAKVLFDELAAGDRANLKAGYED